MLNTKIQHNTYIARVILTDLTSQTHTHRRTPFHSHVSASTAHVRKGSPSAGAVYFCFFPFFSAFCLLSFLPPFSSPRILPLRGAKVLNKLIDGWFEHWLALELPLKFLPFFAFASMGLRLALRGLGLGNSSLEIDKMACL
jgi:hypothetical protein